jgi:sugar lactone lactonase YvrE
VRDTTGEGNGTTFDLEGRLVICEGGNRRVTRWSADGTSEVLMDRYEGKRLNRPNDVVANTGWTQYIHAVELDAAGRVLRRRIFADMSSDETDGVPDGMKVDVEGRVHCTGPGGTWVFAPDGTRLGIIRTPEVPANLCFGGPDLRTLFFTAKTAVYSLRMNVAGRPQPWYARYSRR